MKIQQLDLKSLFALHPCADGKEFIQKCSGDIKTIWTTCERGDWLIWIMRRTDGHDDMTYRKIAVAFAEKVLPLFEKKYPKDTRPRDCIAAIKKFIQSPTDENREAMRSARSAAAAAYAAADAAYAAAAYAAAAYAAADRKEFLKWGSDTVRSIVNLNWKDGV